jgi:hypothetical protein
VDVKGDSNHVIASQNSIQCPRASYIISTKHEKGASEGVVCYRAGVRSSFMGLIRKPLFGETWFPNKASLRVSGLYVKSTARLFSFIFRTRVALLSAKHLVEVPRRLRRWRRAK